MAKTASFGRRLQRTVMITLLLILVIGTAGALLIAEPWISDPTEHMIAPQTTDMGYIELSLGDDYIFDIKLGANEIISSIDSEHPTVIEPIGYGVKANGAQTPVNVTVTTREAVLGGQGKRILFLGRDYSEPYYNLRRALRSMLGIKNAYTLPSELRVIHIYHYRFVVPDYPVEDAGHITIQRNRYTDLSPKGVGGNIYTLIRIGNPDLLSVKQLVTDNDYRLYAKAAGHTEVTVMYGFYINAAKPNQFVPIKASRYTVTVP